MQLMNVIKLGRYAFLATLLSLSLPGCGFPTAIYRGLVDKVPNDLYRPPTLFADDPAAARLLHSSREYYVRHGRLLDPRQEKLSPGFSENDVVSSSNPRLYDIASGRLSDISKEHKRVARNLLQNRIIAKSNLVVSEHLSKISSSQDIVNLALGLGALTFDGLGASLTGGSTSQIMSVVSGGLTASKTLISEEVFQEMFAPLIIEAIILNRKSQLLEIIEKQSRDITAYDVEAAILDAVEYHEMGGFYYGMTLVQKHAAERQQAISADIEGKLKSQEIVEVQSQIRENLEEISGDAGEIARLNLIAQGLGFDSAENLLGKADLDKLKMFASSKKPAGDD